MFPVNTETAPAAASAGLTETRSTAYAIAARAGVDHRPVARWLRGERSLPRGVVGERIVRAARELGIAPPPPQAA